MRIRRTRPILSGTYASGSNERFGSLIQGLGTSRVGSDPGSTLGPLRWAKMKLRFVSVLLLLCGCFSYRNTAVSDAALNAPVRVELTEAGSQELTNQVG